MRRIRWNIITLCAILTSLGIVFLFSSSGIYAYLKFKDSYYFVKRQILFLIIGITLASLISFIDLRRIRSKSRLLLFLALMSLLLVLLFGHRVGGAKRWFKVFGFGLQPIEFTKIIYVLYLADFLERKRFYLHSLKLFFLPIILIAGLMMFLLLLQPDFGNVICIASLTIFMLYFGGVPLRYLFYLSMGALPLVLLTFWKLPYLKLRVLAFLNPWRYPKDIGFQLIQSYLAIGSGGLFGQGLGCSKQKLFFLPAAHTDFIFSIIAEEVGFVGAFGLLLVYFFLIWNFMRLVKEVKGLFEKLLLAGLAFVLCFQIVVNIGVCLGLLPTKGLPLPFISYGGSALVANLLMIGMALNLTRIR